MKAEIYFIGLLVSMCLIIIFSLAPFLIHSWVILTGCIIMNIVLGLNIKLYGEHLVK